MNQATAAITESSNWPAQGEWTYEDYARLPDDGWRYEIIQGVLYVSPAPSYRHQSVVSNLLFLFRLFLREHPVARAVPAPVDVVLPGIAAPVQPDLVVVANEQLERIVDERVEGAPDLLVEVLSPSNWLNDRREKYAAYAQAGVREYWIVDPTEETVEVFVLERETYGLLGKYGPQERVQSETLIGFEPAVEDIFDG